MHHDKTCFWCGRYTSNIGSMCASCNGKVDESIELKKQAAQQVSLIRMHPGGVMHRIHAATGVWIPVKSATYAIINSHVSRFWQTELREMIVRSRVSGGSDVVFGARLPVVPFGNGVHHGNLVFRIHAVRGEGAMTINTYGGIGKQEDKRFAAIWSNGFTEQHMKETR